MLKIATTTLCTLGLLATLPVATAAEKEVATGKIEKVAKDHIVLKVKKESHKIDVNSSTQITLNGEKAALTDLKSGFQATVTCNKEGTKRMATKIVARSKAASSQSLVFAEEKAEKFRGTIKKTEKTSLHVQNLLKKVKSFEVGSATTVTLDGKKSTFAALKVGHTVTITYVEKDGKLMAKSIAAKSSDS